MAGSAAGAFDKGRRLARLVGERRALLVLDGLEPLQYAPTSPTPGEIKDQGVAALLKGLAATSLGLCVVTTRYAITDLRAYRQTTAPMHDLPRLSTAAGVTLLRTIGVKTGSQADFEKLVEDVDGHALTLQNSDNSSCGPSTATSAAATTSASRKQMRKSRAATPSARWGPM